MDMAQAITQLKLKLENHYMISKFVIEEKFDDKTDREYILLRLWMTQLRDEVSEFTKLLSLARSAVPKEFKIVVRLTTEI